MKSSILVTTKPNSEPLTIDEVKLHLGVGGNEFDSRIAQLIAGARKRIERLTNRRLITQSLSIYFDSFPGDREIRIPVAPIQSITNLKYYDADNVQQTFDSASYHTDIVSEPGRIILADGYTWPTTKIGRPSVVELNVVAGYGDGSEDIDEGIIDAMLMMIEKVFDRPDENYQKALDRVSSTSLSPYTLRRF